MTIVTSCGEVPHRLLDHPGGGRVERRARLVHQQHPRLDRHRPGDAQALLLAAGQAAAGGVEAVLDLVPQAAEPQAVLDEVVLVGAGRLGAGELQPGEHVVADRHRRERVGLLEHHADLATGVGELAVGCVDVLPVEQHLAGELRARHQLVHPVEGAQERRLAAAGRADQRGDPACLHRQRDPVEDQVVTEPAAHLARLERRQPLVGTAAPGVGDLRRRLCVGGDRGHREREDSTTGITCVGSVVVMVESLSVGMSGCETRGGGPGRTPAHHPVSLRAGDR